MTLGKLIESIDLDYYATVISGTNLLSEFDIDRFEFRDYESEATERLKEHFYHKWLCTDTVVGYCLYSLDNKVVARSKQECRKCPVSIEWVDEESYYKTKEYLEQFEDEQDEEDIIDILNPNEVISDKCVVEYTSQLVESKLYLNVDGENVPVTFFGPKKISANDDLVRSILNRTSRVKLPNEKIVEVETSDLFTPIKLKSK